MNAEDETQKDRQADAIAQAWEETLSVSNSNWARLTVFRGMGTNATKAESAEIAVNAAKQMAADERAQLGDFRGGRFGPRVFHADFLDKLDATTHEDLARAVNAAVIVFAHSILDNVVTSICDLVLKSSPEKGLELVADRKVSLGDVAKGDIRPLLSAAVEKKSKDLSNESLRKRIRFLFEHCPSLPKAATYVPDLDRIDRFDNARQDVVHKAKFEGLLDSSEELDFIQHTCTYVAVRFLQNYRHLFLRAERPPPTA